MQFDNLTKDKSIKQLLNHLVSKYGSDSFKLTDYWEADLCAIGLSDVEDKHLIYISTYQKEEKQYFISLEHSISVQTDNLPYIPKGDFDNIDLIKLEYYFAKHLEIETTTPNTSHEK